MKAGDIVETDYNGKKTRVTITEIDSTRANGHSQTGIMFRVEPPLKNGVVNSKNNSWYDSAWFKPVSYHNQATVDSLF